jgi:hypothetical protein
VNAGSRLVEAAGGFCSAGKRAEVQEFFVAHPVATERTVESALESIDSCVRLREAQEPKLKAWLDMHTGLRDPHGSE